MPGEAFEYAVLRVAPRVDRGELVNAGVVLYCRTLRFLDCRIELDEARRRVLLALEPTLDLDGVLRHLAVIEQIVRGDPAGGTVATLAAPERFRWVVSPSSTMIQPSEVHTGVTTDPAASLEHLFVAQLG
ncbi:MAG TPA: DUF3037 domain-containing protein [Candidatus Sulfomarinibacteraceae bacterium]|nr:DUF3037 domain-containing protein [Candidatus Sulfomarinibacteraceae bacterium]